MAILFAAALWAGIQNALAGGGSFVTLPALILSGLDARAANIASTIALFPGQSTTGFVGRKMVSGAAGLAGSSAHPLMRPPFTPSIVLRISVAITAELAAAIAIARKGPNSLNEIMI